jgi:hypothetical protein
VPAVEDGLVLPPGSLKVAEVGMPIWWESRSSTFGSATGRTGRETAEGTGP